MEYIDNCLYNGVELPKLPENLPYAGRIIVNLESFGYLLVSTNTIPEVSGTALEWGDNNLSVGYEIVSGEWVAGASGAGSLGSIADGYFLWTNNTIYNSDGSVHLAVTPIVRISTDTEEINAGVYKYWHFTFKDGDDNTLADPKATYDLLITNDVTGDILTEADWINMNNFPKVYIYNTSPEHHTVRIMMTWEGTDGLKYRAYENIVIGEVVAVEPDPEPEEPVVKPFELDLKSFQMGLATGLSGKPLPPVKKEPVAYLYNGVRLPKLPEWDRGMYPYAFIRYVETEDYYRFFAFAQRPYASTKYGLLQVRYTGDYFYTCFGEYCNATEDWREPVEHTYSSTQSDPDNSVYVWADFDIINEDDNSVFFGKCPEPIPVYE